MQRLSPWLAAIFFLGCLALGYLVVRQQAEITGLRLHWDTAEKETKRQIAELQRQLVAASASQAAANKPMAPSSPAAPATSQNGGPNGGPRIIHIGEVMKDHPEYAALYAKQLRRQINSTYGNNLSKLNLPPEQLAQLKDLLVERQMSSIDAQGAAEAAGLARGTPAWQDAIKQASQNVEQQISGILGDNADGTLMQLQVQNNLQNQVTTNYAPDFADAGVPLTSDQSAGLVQAMADANYGGKDTSTRPANYNVPDPTTGLSAHDDRILNGAAQVLSPAQLQVLKSDQIADEAQASALKPYGQGSGPTVLMP